VALLATFALLQRQIWWSRDSVAANARLEQRLERLRVRLKADRFRDDLLRAEVRNLERGRKSLAAAVRYNLGYVRPGERFYQVMIEPTPAAPSRSPPGRRPTAPASRPDGD
jgi:cell division protein FtsB